MLNETSDVETKSNRSTVPETKRGKALVELAHKKVVSDKAKKLGARCVIPGFQVVFSIEFVNERIQRRSAKGAISKVLGPELGQSLSGRHDKKRKDSFCVGIESRGHVESS